MSQSQVIGNPSLNPNIQLGNEKVDNNAPALYTGYANIDESQGMNKEWAWVPWGVDDTTLETPSTPSMPVADITLGPSVANYVDGVASTGIAGLTVFKSDEGYVYQLTATSGTNSNFGTNNSIIDSTLQSTNFKPITLDHQVLVSCDAQVMSSSGDAAYGGMIMTVAFNLQGTANYNANLPTFSVFLANNLVDTRGDTHNAIIAYTSLNGDNTGSSSNEFSDGGLYTNPETHETIYDPSVNQALSATPDGEIHTITDNVNTLVNGMIHYLVSTTTDSNLAQAYEDTSNWSLTGIMPQVEASSGSISIQLSNLNVTEDTSIGATYSYDPYAISQTASDEPADLNATILVNGVPQGTSSNNNNSDGNSSASPSTSDISSSDSETNTDYPTDTGYTVANDGSITTSNELGRTVSISNAEGAEIIARSSTLNLTESSLSDTSLVFLTNNAIVNATENGGASDFFRIGSDGSSCTLNVSQTDSNDKTISMDTHGSGTQTITNLNPATGSRNITVFVSGDTTNYLGGSGLLVANSSGNTTNLNVSGSNNEVWAGGGTTTINADGYNQVIMGNGEGLNGTLDVNGGTQTDRVVVDIFGSTSQTQNINQSGDNYIEIFGEAWENSTNINADMTNGIIVTKGDQSTAHITASGQGTLQVWAEGGKTYYDDAGTGSSQVYTMGDGPTFITDSGSNPNGNSVLTVGVMGTGDVNIQAGSKLLSTWTGDSNETIIAGSGGLFVDARGSGTLNLDVLNGLDTIDILGAFAGDVTVSHAKENISAGFNINEATGSSVSNGNLVVNLADGHTVTFLGVADSSQVNLITSTGG